MPAAQISAVILARDEADRIADCIRSVAFCDEVLVVDSLSTDGTAAVARRLGARVIERAWPGYRSQREFAVAAARHDWILSIDADERVTPRLRGEIERLRAAGFPGNAGYSYPRALDYFGRFLRHGNTWPDRSVRLFDRRRARYDGYEVHEKLRIDGPVGRLDGEVEHYAYRSYDEHVARMQRYAQLWAQHARADGRRAHAAQLWVNPAWRFLRGYVLRRGFLDGWRGLVFHAVEAGYVRQKFLRLYLLQNSTAPEPRRGPVGRARAPAGALATQRSGAGGPSSARLGGGSVLERR